MAYNGNGKGGLGERPTSIPKCCRFLVFALCIIVGILMYYIWTLSINYSNMEERTKRYSYMLHSQGNEQKQLTVTLNTFKEKMNSCLKELSDVQLSAGSAKFNQASLEASVADFRARAEKAEQDAKSLEEAHRKDLNSVLNEFNECKDQVSKTKENCELMARGEQLKVLNAVQALPMGHKLIAALQQRGIDVTGVSTSAPQTEQQSGQPVQHQDLGINEKKPEQSGQQPEQQSGQLSAQEPEKQPGQQSGQADKTAQTQQTGQSVQQSGQAQQTGQSGQQSEPEKQPGQQSGQADKTAQTQQTGQSVQQSEPEKQPGQQSGQANKTAQTQETGQSVQQSGQAQMNGQQDRLSATAISIPEKNVESAEKKAEVVDNEETAMKPDQKTNEDHDNDIVDGARLEAKLDENANRNEPQGTSQVKSGAIKAPTGSNIVSVPIAAIEDEEDEDEEGENIIKKSLSN